jgi:hypothetical protein
MRFGGASVVFWIGKIRRSKIADSSVAWDMLLQVLLRKRVSKLAHLSETAEQGSSEPQTASTAAVRIYNGDMT